MIAAAFTQSSKVELRFHLEQLVLIISDTADELTVSVEGLQL
jgi:hypothetical protein